MHSKRDAEKLPILKSCKHKKLATILKPSVTLTKKLSGSSPALMTHHNPMPDLLLTNKKKDNSASVAASTSLTAASSSPLILALPSNKVQSLELNKHIHPLANHTKANANQASDEELEVFSTAL